ncbi:MAG: class I SAM-dependent methyltransferase [Wolinella sp.]
MHYFIYPKGTFGKELGVLFDYLARNGEIHTYEFIDDSDSQISLETTMKRGLGEGKIMLASQKVQSELLKNLGEFGVSEYIDGFAFQSDKLKEIGERGAAEYWDAHMVISEDFETAEESWEHFEYNCSLYTDYRKFIPIEGLDDKVVLDYGCGPGSELVGIAVKSNPKRLIGADISKRAMERAERRLALHGKNAEFLWINEHDNKIPLESESVDYINCPGVLMNALDLNTILSEFNRVLKRGGVAAIMVYNYDSIWLHLYAAYLYLLEHPEFEGEDILEIYRRTTDGEHCPISTCYKPEQFIEIMNRYGFDGSLVGIAMTVDEMIVLPKRFEAIKDRRLKSEHRNFLMNLTFDERGIPHYGKNVAGTHACYRFIKRG